VCNFYILSCNDFIFVNCNYGEMFATVKLKIGKKTKNDKEMYLNIRELWNKPK